MSVRVPVRAIVSLSEAGVQRKKRPAEPCSGCARNAHALRKIERAEELLRVWARGRDVALSRAAAKLLRQLAEVG